MAALSVQSSGGTSFSRSSALPQSSAGALAQERVGGDPAAKRDGLPIAASRARSSLAISWPTTAAWKLAARSARRASARSDPDRGPRRESAVFSPLKLKSSPGSRAIATGNSKASGSPSVAARWIAGPPG